MTKKKEKRTRSPKIIVITGGKGRTCQNVIDAALAQFEGTKVEVVIESHVHTVDRAKAIVAKTAATGDVICHSLVVPGVRQAVLDETLKRHVPAADMMGPVLGILTRCLAQGPRHQPGLSHRLLKHQFDRFDAMDFTLGHDDGRNPKDLKKADVVLVGVSRVTKSVTSFFLAYQGVRAANVPLIIGQPPLPELFEVARRKVIGLTTVAPSLEVIRKSRIEVMGSGPFGEYGNQRAIMRELRFAEGLMRKNRWHIINVSCKGVEEIAHEVLLTIGRGGARKAVTQTAAKTRQIREKERDSLKKGQTRAKKAKKVSSQRKIPRGTRRERKQDTKPPVLEE